MTRVLFIAVSLVLASSMSLPARSSQSSMFLPGGSYDRPAGIAVDASGRAFLAINTQSRDYGQPRRLLPAEAWLPRTQAFVTRIDTDGTQTHWPITEASLSAIAIDAAGYIYVAGSRSMPHSTDVFFARLRPSGSVEYSVTFGGAADDVAMGVAVDAAGNIFVVGGTSSPDFRSSRPSAPCRGSAATGMDAFVVRIDTAGSIAESTCLGGALHDAAYGVALDPKGDLVIAGATRSADFPATEGAYQSRSTDRPCLPKVECGDAFVAKLSSGELRVLWATYLGGSARELPEGFAVDAAGDIYITGSTTSRDLPLHDALQPACLTAYTGGDCGDAFIVKLANSGSSLLFGSFIGGPAWETATGVAISPAGDIYVSGATSSTILLDRHFQTTRQDTDSFLVVLDRAHDVLDVRVINHGRNERMEGVAGGWRILYLIGSAEVAVPSGTPCCHSDRDAYVTTIRSATQRDHR
jgi:DNA-binding beta-propeller fold protein YncE